MTGHAFAILIGAFGGILTISMAVPQAVRVWRDKSGVGVSLMSWCLFLFVYFLWLGYALRVMDVASFTTNILSIITQVALLAGLFVYEAPKNRVGVIAAVIAGSIVFGIAGYTLPMPLLWVLMLLGMSVRLPQAIKSYKTWRDRSASEVSVTTWTLGLISALCWMLHGIFMPDSTFVITSATASLLSIAVITFELLNNARPDHPSASHAH